MRCSSPRCHLDSRAELPAHFWDAITSPAANACLTSQPSKTSQVRSVRPQRSTQRLASRPESQHLGISVRACCVYLPPHRFGLALRFEIDYSR